MSECFSQLKVEQHPDKTFIGRIEKGFDFLGYHFSREPLRVANITVKKHVERFIQLYEQQKTKKATSEEMALVLGLYVKRWRRWCVAWDGATESRASRPIACDRLLCLPDCSRMLDGPIIVSFYISRLCETHSGRPC